MPTDVELEGRALSRWETDGGQLCANRDFVQRMRDTKPLTVKRKRYGKQLRRQLLLNLARDGGWFSLMVIVAIALGLLALLIG